MRRREQEEEEEDKKMSRARKKSIGEDNKSDRTRTRQEGEKKTVKTDDKNETERAKSSGEKGRTRTQENDKNGSQEQEIMIKIEGNMYRVQVEKKASADRFLHFTHKKIKLLKQLFSKSKNVDKLCARTKDQVGSG